jgi:hypothetical protein
MNEVLSVAKSFIFCSFAVLLISISAPKGSTEKIVSLVLVLFTLLSVVAPLKDIKGIRTERDETVVQSENGQTGGDRLINTQIRLLTDEALNSIGIDNYELIINTSSSDDGTVLIDEYTVFVDDISKKDEIISAVNEKTDLTPEIFEMDEMQ